MPLRKAISPQKSAPHSLLKRNIFSVRIDTWKGTMIHQLYYIKRYGCGACRLVEYDVRHLFHQGKRFSCGVLAGGWLFSLISCWANHPFISGFLFLDFPYLENYYIERASSHMPESLCAETTSQQVQGHVHITLFITLLNYHHSGDFPLDRLLGIIPEVHIFLFSHCVEWYYYSKLFVPLHIRGFYKPTHCNMN
jgi:hypothetical protein